MRRIAIIILSLTMLLPLGAQNGKSTYQYLAAPVSSRMAALGGANVSLRSGEITDAIINPALLTDETHNSLSLNFGVYVANTLFGTVGYSYNYKDNYFAASVQYADYGKFDGADEVGLSTGRFSARDFAFNITYGRRINDMFSVGVTLKPLYSAYERYSSVGLAADIGAYFLTRDSLFSMGLALRNAGVQLKGFHDDEDGGQYREKLPINLMFGLSLRFRHAPFRFHVTFHNLQRWNLNYQYSNHTSTSLDGGSTSQDNNIKGIDMFFRHTIWAVDILAGKYVCITAAYNHQRQREYSAQGFKSAAGLSFGAQLTLKKFHLGYAAAQYQKGNWTHNISLQLNIQNMLK
ncbi:MAG TPA: hypothetical protein DEO38_02740 [Bacteroidales bacterium]|nr:hypothetical protein [Bacteroidales bacterium]